MLQVDLLLRPANLTGPVPTWHGAPSQVNHCVPKNSPNQPPTIIYKTAAKEINRPRSQDNTPGRQFGLKLNNKQSTQVIRWPLPNVVSEVAAKLGTNTSAIAKVFHLVVAAKATAKTSFSGGRRVHS